MNCLICFHIFGNNIVQEFQCIFVICVHRITIFELDYPPSFAHFSDCLLSMGKSNEQANKASSDHHQH